MKSWPYILILTIIMVKNTTHDVEAQHVHSEEVQVPEGPRSRTQEFCVTVLKMAETAAAPARRLID